jgi:DNA polymerase-3 subunit delta
MKLSPRDAPGYFARPDRGKAGLLIYGPDPMRIALRRQQVIAALLKDDTGDEPAELRLTRLAPSDLRGDPAALGDAMRAQGFFGGGAQRVVQIEGALDAQAKPIAAALEDWQPGDAVLVATAGNLGKGSALRKLFEGHKGAYAAAVYADPPGRAEIEAVLAKAGLRDVPAPAMAELTGLAQTLDPGDFAQTVEKLALYKLDDPAPVSSADIAAVAPLSAEAGLDELVQQVAGGDKAHLQRTLRRLQGQGVAPVALCIAATRHFRTLHAIAGHPGGPSQGIGALRPPLFGPRRDRMLGQARHWGVGRLEQALALLLETDLQLRGGGLTAPQSALAERALFRLCYMGSR